MRIRFFLLATSVWILCGACGDDSRGSPWQIEEDGICREGCEATALLRTKDDALEIVLDPAVTFASPLGACQLTSPQDSAFQRASGFSSAMLLGHPASAQLKSSGIFNVRGRWTEGGNQFEVADSSLAVCETARQMAECLRPPTGNACVANPLIEQDERYTLELSHVGDASELLMKPVASDSEVQVELALRVPFYHHWSAEVLDEEQVVLVQSRSTPELKKRCFREDQVAVVEYDIQPHGWYAVEPTARPQLTAVGIRATVSANQEVPNWCDTEPLVVWADLVRE